VLVAWQTAGVMKLATRLLRLLRGIDRASLTAAPLHNGNIPTVAPYWALLLPSPHPREKRMW
jgi:hypothetical protein